MIDTYKRITVAGSGSVDDTPELAYDSSSLSLEQTTNGFYITNLDEDTTLLIKMTNDFENAPDMAGDDYHFKITPGNWLELIVSNLIALWVCSEDNTTVAFNYVGVQ